MENRLILIMAPNESAGASPLLRKMWIGLNQMKIISSSNPFHVGAFKKCEEFLNTVGARNLQLAKRWGILSGVSHPTCVAAKNSAAIIGGFIFQQARPDLTKALEEKKADFMLSVSTLIATILFESPAWIPLGLDVEEMPTAKRVHAEAAPVVISILTPRHSPG